MAIPNGGHRNKAVAAKLKAEGVSRGVPDIFIPSWHLWVEMKRAKGGSLTSEQRIWINYLEHHGYTCLVCKGHREAIEKVEAFVSFKLLNR